ncbi:MAG: hypothetical protein QM572_09315 [Nocardioides sp.]|uniref:hypothetical protein n=1 Tax=Nocardioides sp. TaxID=35761 RepID=UPI0039E39538
MRTQAERDERTLDIAGAVLGGAAAWVALGLLGALALSLLSAGDGVWHAAAALALAGFAATVMVSLARRGASRR